MPLYLSLFACAIFAAAFAAQAASRSQGRVEPDSPRAAPRFDAWKVIGPGGGGAQFHPHISPHDPKDVLNSTDMSEAYISHDGGESWRMFNIRGHIRFMLWDPVDPNTAYAKTAGLFRTTDGARTWRLVHPAPSNVARVAAIGDHGFERIITKDGSDESVEALAVDPADSKVLYAAMSSASRYYLSVSRDSGATWKKDADLPDGGRHVWVDAGSTAASRTIYVAGDSSMSVREGGRWTLRKGPEGVKSFNEVSMGFDAKGRPVIYAASGPGWRGSDESVAAVFASDDAGATWKRIDGGIVALVPKGREGVIFQTVAACPTRPDVAYVSYKGQRVVPDRKERYLGVAKTTDRGRTWQLVWADAAKPGPNMKDAWMNDRFGPEWGENPFHIDVARDNPGIAYATDFGRTMRTTDGGKTWVGVYSKQMPDGGWTTTGLDMTTCYGVHWDPFDSKRVFISYTDIGLFRSENGGTTWTSATAHGVPEPWINTTYWVVFDPEVRGRAWAVMSAVHDLPFPKMWQRTAVSTYLGGVVATEDGGVTWRKSSDGMRETAATDIILDPKSPSNARVLYVAGLGTGVWKSADGGRTWKLKNNGIAGREPFAWRIVMDPKGVLYAVVARRSWDGSYGNEGDGALYRSTDGAETWHKLPLPAKLNGPHGIAIDPDNTDRLYLAMWGRYAPEGDVDGGIFLSEDAGKTWKNIFAGQQHVYDVIIEARNHDVLYAGTMTFSVWRSADRGKTWSRIKGYNFKQANRVVLDPAREDRIYVTTFGGSVWYGPAEGDPNAPEDVVTPEVRY